MRFHTVSRPVVDDGGIVIGYEQVNIQFTEEEEAEADAREASFLLEAPKLEIKRQITALEVSITDRMIREALLGSTKTNPAKGNKTARQLIQEIEDQITVLQGKL